MDKNIKALIALLPLLAVAFYGGELNGQVDTNGKALNKMGEALVEITNEQRELHTQSLLNTQALAHIEQQLKDKNNELSIRPNQIIREQDTTGVYRDSSRGTARQGRQHSEREGRTSH